MIWEEINLPLSFPFSNLSSSSRTSSEKRWKHMNTSWTDRYDLIFCLNLWKIDQLEATQMSKEQMQDVYQSGALWPVRTRCWWWSRLLPEGHSSGSFSGLRRRDAIKIKQRSCNVAHQRIKITFTQIEHSCHVFNCCTVNYNKIIKQPNVLLILCKFK